MAIAQLSQSDAMSAAVKSSPREGAQVMEMQRRRLLLALGELLAEGRLEAATVGRISARAGVSRRTFYEMFEDREACLLAAFDREVEVLAPAVRSAYERPGSWRERLRAALAVLLARLDERPAIAGVCVVAPLRAGPEMLARRAHLLATLADAIDQGRAESPAGIEPPPLTAQAVVGGVVSVIHDQALERSDRGACSRLLGPLSAMIAYPYLGSEASREELERPTPSRRSQASPASGDPFKDLPIRFTYRTARVLETIASNPGASNRVIANSSGIADEGQVSRLLRRLQSCDLIRNGTGPLARGEPNAWTLTERGEAIHTAVGLRPE